MSGYHVLEQVSQHNVRVAFHFTVPNQTNEPNKSYRDCIKEARDANDPITQVPWLEADFGSEYTDITNGIVVEHVEVFGFGSEMTNQEKIAALNARHTELAAKIWPELQAKYEFWGYNAS